MHRAQTLQRLGTTAFVTLWLLSSSVTEAQIDHRRDVDVLGYGGSVFSQSTYFTTYACGLGPLCGSFWSTFSFVGYEVPLPAPRTAHAIGVRARVGSIGWTGHTGNTQGAFCGTRGLTDHKASLYNVAHYVYSGNLGTGFFPCAPTGCVCAATIERVAARGIVALADPNGVFGITVDGRLERRFYQGGWQTDVIPPSGADPVPGSLIPGEGVGVHANVYGVNADGQLFTTWNDNGTLRYALVPGTQDLVPGSLVSSQGNGVFGVTTSGGLVRSFYQGGWQTETIAHYGGALEPGTLIASPSSGNVRGVNVNGQIVTTWNNGGNVNFALIPGTQDIASIIETTSKGIFAVTEAGVLQRVWWSNGAWQVQTIPTSTVPLAPGSFVVGGGSGPNGSLYGLDVDGRAVNVAWFNNGAPIFGTIPGTQNLLQLAWKDINGLFSIATDGELRRTYWQSGAWHTDVLGHVGPDLVAESLIPGEGTGIHANVYGIAEDGTLFTTWNDNGTIRFAQVP